MRVLHYRNPAIILVALAALLSVTLPVSGQARVQIVPQIVEQVISPGGTLNEIITFTNAGRGPAQVTLELADFDVDEAGNPQISPLGTSVVTLAPYLRVSPVRALVQPGQSTRFRVVAKLPQDFDHKRVMLYFTSTSTEVPEGPTQTIIVPKIGVPIYVESTASAPANLELTDVSISRSESKPDRIVLTTRSTNTGDRIIRPPVTVEVSEKNGSFYEVFEPNEGVAPVFPHRTRIWSFELGPVPGGELEVRLTFPTSRRNSFRQTYTIAAAQKSQPDTAVD